MLKRTLSVPTNSEKRKERNTQKIVDDHKIFFVVANFIHLSLHIQVVKCHTEYDAFVSLWLCIYLEVNV